MIFQPVNELARKSIFQSGILELFYHVIYLRLRINLASLKVSEAILRMSCRFFIETRGMKLILVSVTDFI